MRHSRGRGKQGAAERNSRERHVHWFGAGRNDFSVRAPPQTHSCRDAPQTPFPTPSSRSQAPSAIIMDYTPTLPSRAKEPLADYAVWYDVLDPASFLDKAGTRERGGNAHSA